MSGYLAMLLGLAVLVLVFGVGILGGRDMAHEELAERTEEVTYREAKLQAEWDALHTAQHLNAAFMEARRAMAEEAIRQSGRQDGL